MRYAELTFVDRSEETVQVLVRFQDAQERDEAAADFGRFYGRDGVFRDITWREARATYDLGRLDRARYLVDVTIADGPREGETREIFGVYAPWYETLLEERALDRALGSPRRYRPNLTLDQLLDDINESEGAE